MSNKMLNNEQNIQMYTYSCDNTLKKNEKVRIINPLATVGA